MTFIRQVFDEPIQINAGDSLVCPMPPTVGRSHFTLVRKNGDSEMIGVTGIEIKSAQTSSSRLKMRYEEN